MHEDRRPLHAGEWPVVDGEPRQVGRRDRPDRDAGRRRHDLAFHAVEVPAGNRVEVAKAQGQVDRAPLLRGIEARHRVSALHFLDAALEQAGAHAAAPAVLGHQHHADPGELLAEREHQRTRLPRSVWRRAAEAASGAQHEAPVGDVLVPARLDRQRPYRVALLRIDRLDVQPVSTCHRAPRSAWACSRWPCRAPASRSSTRSSSTAARWGPRTPFPFALHRSASRSGLPCP